MNQILSDSHSEHSPSVSSLIGQPGQEVANHELGLVRHLEMMMSWRSEYSGKHIRTTSSKQSE